MFDVGLGCFYGVVCSVLMMTVCEVRVVRGSLVFPVLVVLCSFFVVSRCVLMMLGCVVMVVYGVL